MLLVAGSLTVALAYAAMRAGTGRRTTQEEALRSHAVMAAREFARRASIALEDSATRAIRPLFEHCDGPRLPRIDSTGEAVWFRMAPDSVTFEVSPVECGSTDLGVLIRERIRENEAQGGERPILLTNVCGGQTILLSRLRVPPNNDPRIHGRLLPASWIRNVLNLDRSDLLPGRLAQEQILDSVATVLVLGSQGTHLSRVGAATMVHAADDGGTASQTYEGYHTIRAAGESLIVQVGLAPEAAGLLNLGSLNPTRLPILAGLLGTSLAFLIVSALSVRRERRVVAERIAFLAGVTHELRTPLSIVSMFSEMLSSADHSRSGLRPHWASLINREAGRLSASIDNIHHYAGAPAGLDEDPVEIELTEFVDRIAERIGPLAAARGSRLSVDAEEAWVRIPENMLSRVLTNLLDNAIKYGPRNQVVTMTARRFGDSLAIHVDDRGPGISPKDRSRIWRPFVRLEHARASGQGGSGLGLALSRDLIEAYGGRLVVEDAPGGGARFTTFLPVG